LFEPVTASGLVDGSGVSSLRGSCLDRLSLIVEGLNTTPTSAPDTATAGSCDVTSHVTLHDKMAAAQAANC